MMLETDYKKYNVTPELFWQWHSPRRGEANPSRLDNPVWNWLIHWGGSAYQARAIFAALPQFDPGASPVVSGPGWSFDRFGQTETKLADGRVLYIAGEHEDYYDPDFYIYNDVVVVSPGKPAAIYLYPRELFPPTDFHTATLLEDSNSILIVGNLGYREDRLIGKTAVFRLDLTDYSIEKVITTGTSPGWIHKHQATLSDDRKSIIIENGLLQLDTHYHLFENIDVWELHLDAWRWERLTKRQWPQWIISRSDGQAHHIHQMRNVHWMETYAAEDVARGFVTDLQHELGQNPDLDLLTALYRPPVTHTELPQIEDEYGVYRIQVGDVVVRYVEGVSYIQVIVEGDLPPPVLVDIRSDLLEKFARLENIEPFIESIAG